MKQYVAGFMFDYNADQVVLVQKNRPTWQAGLWNGVGGSIEANETPEEAMRREFREETSVDHDIWRHFATLRGRQFEVAFFAAADRHAVLNVQTVTDEKIAVFDVDNLPETLPNIHWLVPMAVCETPGRGIPFLIQEYGSYE